MSSVESYAHRAAKAVLVSWLRDAAAAAWAIDDLNPTISVLGMTWRVNRGPPYYGIHEEVPVLRDGTGIEPVWDEVCLSSCPDDFVVPPSFDQLVSYGLKPRAILDIGIQHKGLLIIGIEIVHKHALYPEKIDFLYRCHESFSLVQIPAAWVLGQTKCPDVIPSKFWYSLDPYRMAVR